MNSKNQGDLSPTMDSGAQPVNLRPSLRFQIKAYKKRIAEIKKYLDAHPDEWGRFQSEFNQEINAIFRDLMLFEKDNLAKGREDKVYKLKKLFTEKFRNDFVVGEYLHRSLEKPLGYAGDYKIIDDIYRNSPSSKGFDRLYDNYFQMSTICIAVRNRKEDFKRIIFSCLEKAQGAPVKMMDLAAGPCRDIYEVLSDPQAKNSPAAFHCLDSDENALEYGRNLLRSNPAVHFIPQNAVRIGLMKNVEEKMEGGYDLIFSTGLFDYLDKRISVRLVTNLRKLLKIGGTLAISDVRDKFSNPSIYFMEWVADWNLLYRNDDDFRDIFLESGFAKKNLSIQYEQQGIMQYVLAVKSET